MKELKIANTDRVALVDDEDYERLLKYRYYYHTSITRIKTVLTYSKSYSLANDVMQNKDLMYDHIDRNPFNNQKCNLRPCNYSLNGGNRSKHKMTKSKYKGVDFAKGKWRARIMCNGNRESLGVFDSEEAAAKAYDKRAVEIFGEFAALNFPINGGVK